MKHKLLEMIAVSSALLGAPLTINYLQSGNTVEASNRATAYTRHKSITYSDKSGKMTITGVEALHMKYSDNSSAGSQIIIYGKFTNKSRKGISPQDFAADHFKFYQLKRSKIHELTPVAPIVMTPTKHIDNLSSNGEDLTRPHKTVSFAISDDDPISLSSKQKVLIRAYKETEITRRLASKILTAPRTQNAMDHNDVPCNENPYTSVSQRKAIKEANSPHKKAKKQKIDSYDGDTYVDSIATLTKPFRQDYFVRMGVNNHPTYVTVLEFYLTNKANYEFNVANFLSNHIKVEPDLNFYKLNLVSSLDFPINLRVDQGIKKANEMIKPKESAMIAIANISYKKPDFDIDTVIKNDGGKEIGLVRSKFKVAYPVDGIFHN